MPAVCLHCSLQKTKFFGFIFVNKPCWSKILVSVLLDIYSCAIQPDTNWICLRDTPLHSGVLLESPAKYRKALQNRGEEWLFYKARKRRQIHSWLNTPKYTSLRNDLLCCFCFKSLTKQNSCCQQKLLKNGFPKQTVQGVTTGKDKPKSFFYQTEDETANLGVTTCKKSVRKRRELPSQAPVWCPAFPSLLRGQVWGDKSQLTSLHGI